MFAKIKDNQIIQFPYGYDDLQADNPFTLFNGVIDLKEIFDQSELALFHGYELVEVEIDDVPSIFKEIQKASLSNLPVLENGRWVLKWIVVNVQPDEL